MAAAHFLHAPPLERLTQKQIPAMRLIKSGCEIFSRFVSVSSIRGGARWWGRRFLTKVFLPLGVSSDSRPRQLTIRPFACIVGFVKDNVVCINNGCQLGGFHPYLTTHVIQQ